MANPNYDPIVRLMCLAHDLPFPEKEIKFHPTRKWRLDYGYPVQKVSFDIDGAVWTGGRHTRGKGFISDLEKFNEAALHGWVCLRCTPQQLDKFEIAPLIKRALGII